MKQHFVEVSELKTDNFKTEEDKVACGEAIRRMYQLESKVDEYLKKMEEQ